MKSKKWLDNGLNCFHVAIIPKAPRSIRRRAQLKKADEDTCAFELLASLAKKLLQESEISASSNASGNDHVTICKDAIEDVHHYECKPVKTECLDQGISEVSVIVAESASQNCDQKYSLNELPIAEDDEIMDSGFLGKNGGDLKSAIGKSNSANDNIRSKVELEGGSPNFGESCYNGMQNRFEQGLETRQGFETGGLKMDITCSLSGPIELGVTYPALINSEKDTNLPSCRDPVHYASVSRQRNDVKLGVRDDDDNLIRNNKFSNKLKVYRPVTCNGDRRIRKLMTSRYWKVAPKLKDFELSRADGGKRPPHRKRKTCHKHERCQHGAFYKRKFHNRSFLEIFDRGFRSESVMNSPERGRKGDRMLKGASGMASSVVDHQASLHSKDSNVKFCIKSFWVPEIFIEVSETTTVASLKRTVMDTLTAILGGGIRVGLLLHGKKIRDDNRTLSQSGISSEVNLDSLGFTLEPSSMLAPSPLCFEDHPLLLPCDTPQLVPRSLATPALELGITNSLPDPSPVTNLSNHVENNQETMTSQTDVLTDTTVLDPRALVPVPGMDVDALPVFPVKQKIRRSEIGERRTRRPFSVSEVEALVQVVEELGTGRWRDVKLRSFEHADHRTYVDLKDKWKTLVHTARISPQQRRGKPVPQELLDRVLAAHAYWSQHQAKHQNGMLKIEAQVEQNKCALPGIY